MKINGMRAYSALAVVVVLLPSIAPKGRPTAPPLPRQHPEEPKASELIFLRRCRHRLSGRLGLLSGPTDASARVEETQEAQVLSGASTGQVNTDCSV